MLTIIDTLMDTQRVEMRRECGESNMTGWIRLRPSNYSSPDSQERHWHELLVTDPRFWRDTCRCWMPQVGPMTIKTRPPCQGNETVCKHDDIGNKEHDILQACMVIFSQTHSASVLFCRHRYARSDGTYCRLRLPCFAYSCLGC